MHQIREGFITSALRIENFSYFGAPGAGLITMFAGHILTQPKPPDTKTTSTWRFVHRIAGHVGAFVKMPL